MVLRGFSEYEARNASSGHVEIGRQIQGFLSDVGEECDVYLEFDDPEDTFSYLFTGTTLSLWFDETGIHVLDYDLDTNEETVLQTFEPGDINKATHWLLIQANQQNQNS